MAVVSIGKYSKLEHHHTVDAHIKNIRKKLGVYGDFLETVRGVRVATLFRCVATTKAVAKTL
jgi:DNA-binding NarL/FixJ family response regulator